MKAGRLSGRHEAFAAAPTQARPASPLLLFLSLPAYVTEPVMLHNTLRIAPATVKG